MQTHLIRFATRKELAEAAAKTGCNEAAAAYFEDHRETFSVVVKGLRSPAASIVKQEILSRGGDAAVHAQVITGGVERSDVIIFGSKKQLSHLADKLERMPWWGLGKLAAEIRALIRERRLSPVTLPCGAVLDFGVRTLVMGIININADSFFRCSRVEPDDAEEAAKRALKMAEDGADVIDIGAESTRPGASRLPEEEEFSRIVSAVREIRKELPKIPLSIDTTRSSVARAALDAGADIINDVSGLQYDEDIAKAVAERGAMLVVMHSRGTPETMGSMCEYGDLISEICAFLRDAAEKAQTLGVPKENIIVDPGLGFAKNYEQNLMIARHAESFRALGYPLLIGASRKKFIGRATGRERPEDRLAGTVALSTVAAWQGADIVRVHDVKENKDAVMLAEALKEAEYA